MCLQEEAYHLYFNVSLLSINTNTTIQQSSCLLSFSYSIILKETAEGNTEAASALLEASLKNVIIALILFCWWKKGKGADFNVNSYPLVST